MRLIDADEFKKYIVEGIKRAKVKEEYADLAVQITKDFLKDIDEQPTVGTWISPEDGLPEDEGTVLICFSGVSKRSVYFDHAYVSAQYYDGDPRPWDLDGDWGIADLVVHCWMTIPQAQGVREKQTIFPESGKWIPVTERLPKAEETVLISADVRSEGRIYRRIVTRGFYEDGTIHSEDSRISGSNDWDAIADYCEETDDYILKTGWYEDTDYCQWDEGNMFLIDDFVVAWMPLPSPYTPEEKTCDEKQ